MGTGVWGGAGELGVEVLEGVLGGWWGFWEAFVDWKVDD